jgi:hypothetical protein
MFVCSMVLALVVLGFVADRTLFLLRAVRTTGNVVDLNATNGRCRCGKRCHYDCTKFQALVRFQTREEPATLWVSAGTSHGHNAALASAQYGVGNPVPVVFNPRNPTEAYRNSLWDVWGLPILTFFFQIATLIGSFTQRRHYY